MAPLEAEFKGGNGLSVGAGRKATIYPEGEGEEKPSLVLEGKLDGGSVRLNKDFVSTQKGPVTENGDQTFVLRAGGQLRLYEKSVDPSPDQEPFAVIKGTKITAESLR